MHLEFITAIGTIIETGTESFSKFVFSKSEPTNQFWVGTGSEFKIIQSKSFSDPPWFRSEFDLLAFLSCLLVTDEFHPFFLQNPFHFFDFIWFKLSPNQRYSLLNLNVNFFFFYLSSFHPSLTIWPAGWLMHIAQDWWRTIWLIVRITKSLKTGAVNSKFKASPSKLELV